MRRSKYISVKMGDSVVQQNKLRIIRCSFKFLHWKRLKRPFFSMSGSSAPGLDGFTGLLLIAGTLWLVHKGVGRYAFQESHKLNYDEKSSKQWNLRV